MAPVIVYADISAFQAGIDVGVLPGPVLVARVASYVSARITAGTFLDLEWPRHRDEARRVGKAPVAYHYIGQTVSPEWQVEQTLRWIGAPPGEIPIMVDWEEGSGDGSWLHAVTDEFIRRGARVPMGYVPRWYWTGHGQPDLRRFPIVVNSDYRTHSPDNPAGWAPLGPAAVGALQYTDRAAHGGHNIDMNAFRGDAEQLSALLGAGTVGSSRRRKILLLND
ncbi:MAG: GH25 family lysozyme [Pseudonocardiaceae bacterium]